MAKPHLFESAPLNAARRAVLLACAGVTGVAVTGCGFELRRAPDLRFRTIQLTGFGPRSPLQDELRMNINASSTTHVVEALAQAQVVLEALTDVRERVVVATSSAGQVTELKLNARFSFRLRSVAGKELIPQTAIMLSRDMSFTESAALAKEQEEAFLFRAMQSDIVSQVMRRLASVQNV